MTGHRWSSAWTSSLSTSSILVQTSAEAAEAMLTAVYGSDEDAVALRRLVAGLLSHRRLRDAAAAGGGGASVINSSSSDAAPSASSTTTTSVASLDSNSGAALVLEVLSSLDGHGDGVALPHLEVETKYYSAQVPVQLTRLLPVPVEAEAGLLDAIAGSEGILLHLPRGDAAREAAIRRAFERVHAHHESVSGGGGPEQLRIAVTISHSDGDDEEVGEGDEGATARLEWCLDHQFELLHVPLHAHLPLSGWSDRDKEGLPRLVEATESHMWSSMARRSGRAGAMAVAMSQPQPHDTSAADATVSATSDGAAATSKTEEAGPEAASGTSNTTSTGVQQGVEEDEDKEEEEEGEIAADEEAKWTVFSQMIDEARRVRDQVQQGSLGDEERRRRAADLASRFASMFMEDESSDEEGA